MRLLALLSLSLLLAGSAASGTGTRRLVLGRSPQGRPVVAYELGDPASPRKVLVVGCIHGNECAGISGSCPTRTRTATPPIPAGMRAAST